jgi:helix-turn-helix protein
MESISPQGHERKPFYPQIDQVAIPKQHGDPSKIPRRKPYSNHRLAKIHRSYTVEESAHLLGVHKNTVRQWIKSGLPTCDKRRPTLILGRHLIDFLRARREKNKRSCLPGQLYCVRCRAPRFPAGNMADYQPVTENVGNIQAICPECDSIINRRVSLAKFGQIRGQIDVRFPQALRYLNESDQSSINSDLR